jgi:hypothetical protein
MPGLSTANNWEPTSMLEPDLILPEQLAATSAVTRNGEFALLWAVFTDGIQSYCKEVLRGSTASLTYREVERWIFRPSSDAITSFSSLCELFSIDPRRMRRALLHYRENPDRGILEVLSQNAA